MRLCLRNPSSIVIVMSASRDPLVQSNEVEEAKGSAQNPAAGIALSETGEVGMGSSHALFTKKVFDLAVFPLSDAVLFPGATMPLQLMEPRYHQMLKEIQARDWPLAIALAVPSATRDFMLSSICGAGPVQVFKQHPDGKTDILVRGERRVKLRSFIQQEPYFIMEAECADTLADIHLPPIPVGERKTLDEFRALVKTWAFLHPSVPDHLLPVFEGARTLSTLCDLFVYHFVKHPVESFTLIWCAFGSSDD